MLWSETHKYTTKFGTAGLVHNCQDYHD